jgi:hypothetical protein
VKARIQIWHSVFNKGGAGRQRTNGQLSKVQIYSNFSTVSSLSIGGLSPTRESPSGPAGGGWAAAPVSGSGARLASLPARPGAAWRPRPATGPPAPSGPGAGAGVEPEGPAPPRPVVLDTRSHLNPTQSESQSLDNI